MSRQPCFSLIPPDESAIGAMHKTWARHRLPAYLKRWEGTLPPGPPLAFWDFPWRACDVGAGFGRFSINESAHHPQRAYLAIDKGRLRGGNMLKRFAASDRPNLFGLHGNAIPILAAMPDAGLDLITLFYPNPWWPAKHRKKRWPYHQLLPKLATLLRPGGTLLLTSNEGFYLGEWVYALTHHPEISGMALEYAGPIRVKEGRTHFEAKFLAEDTPCGEVVFIKSVGSP